MAEVTKEFVETIVKEPVEKFEVRSGSNLGDGYCCAMVSVDIWKKSKPSTPETILIKCYPTSPTRQEFLDQGNIFVIELGVYKTIIPELIKFQRDCGAEEFIPPPMPRFLHGNYIPPEERKNLGRPMNPVDNCIVMFDLREKSNGAFRLRDRFLGFDYEHHILVMRAHATFHALSWAYKCKKGIRSLEKEFPFIRPHFEELMQTFEQLMAHSIKNAESYVGHSPKAVEALEHLESIRKSGGGLYMNFEYGQTKAGHTKDNILRIPGPTLDNEEPWEVLLHGDSWSNNMLFRYDPKTNRPVEVLLIDLQQTREGDPFCDLAYTMYCSGTPDLRRKHLSSLLRVYHDTFEDVCQRLGVPLLPGWSWEEVNRRFNRARVFGGQMASFALPIMLKNVDELTNMDSLAADIEKSSGKSGMENFGEMFAGMTKTGKANPVVSTRLTALLEELRDDGIL